MDRIDVAKELFFSGLACMENGSFREAEEKFRKSLDLVPDRISTMTNLSSALLKQSKFEEASMLLDKVLGLDETIWEAWLNRGLISFEENKLTEALDCFERAISFYPQSAEAHNNIGIVKTKMRRHAAALESFAHALRLRPDYPEAHMNRGNLLKDMRQYAAAFDCYSRALALKSDYAEALVGRGNALSEVRRYQDAQESYERAIVLAPDCAEAYIGSGALAWKMKQHELAIEKYGRALSLKPHADYLLSELVHARMSICAWEHIQDQVGEVLNSVGQDRCVSDPFKLLALTDDPIVQRKCAEKYARENFSGQTDSVLFPASNDHDDRIRIGYYSADFCNHAVSILMAEVFELHDRSRFETVGFDFGAHDREDDMRQRVRHAFDRFLDVRGKSDLEIAEISRASGIDIAVDLGGFTEGARTGIFAMRAAPIQVSYLGYLGTMGTPYMDYILADDVLVPEGHSLHFSEKIAYLPTYQANDSKRRVSERVFTREELGLPNECFVFCCFCNTYKVTPETFGSWMRILQHAKDSVLFLYADANATRANIAKEARRQGVDPDRIVFGGRLPPPEYLARYRAADLFLDTFPYNGGTTASDALWAGLPVLTLMGDSFASRMAASVLTAAGLPELIATTRSDYEARAIELATCPGKLASIKEQLDDNRAASRLFDSRLLTRCIESAFTKMHARYRAGLQPDHIRVNEEGIAPCS